MSKYINMPEPRRPEDRDRMRKVLMTSPSARDAELRVNSQFKLFRSDNYNFDFTKDTGKFTRWGKTKEDNPVYSPYGPEILDIEVSTICNGIEGRPCSHCYKSNTGKGENMSLDTFTKILDKMPETLTQVAFGIGDLSANPDLFNMFAYCRNNAHNQVVPNLTINGAGLTTVEAEKLSCMCGAVAVSRYPENVDVCYDAVEKLTNARLGQTNIHALLSKETFMDCMKAIEDAQTDPRLKKLNAVVFLALKPKGKRNKYRKVTYELFKLLFEYAKAAGVRVGFDSCSAPFFLKAEEDSSSFEESKELAECCESDLFSSYINVHGRYFHCSFTEGEDTWEGIDVLEVNDFLLDVWFSDEATKFRGNLVDQEHSIADDCRLCPIFDLYGKTTFSKTEPIP